MRDAVGRGLSVRQGGLESGLEVSDGLLEKTVKAILTILQTQRTMDF